MTLKEHYEKYSINKFKEIKITDYRDILRGNDLETAKRVDAFSVRGSCHFNAGKVAQAQPFDDWDVSFCEGLYGKFDLPHCWNKLTNKKSGEEYYVDFTIGKGDALLLNEWDNKDIIKLFNVTRNAFVPFRDFLEWTENKRAKAILNKYYKVG